MEPKLSRTTDDDKSLDDEGWRKKKSDEAIVSSLTSHSDHAPRERERKKEKTATEVSPSATRVTLASPLSFPLLHVQSFGEREREREKSRGSE